MHQKGFAPILIILVAVVIVALGGIVYYAMQTSVPSGVQNQSQQPSPTPPSTNLSSTADLVSTSSVSTSNWLTYTDSQDGFSFRYPPECHFETSSLSDRRVISFLPCAPAVSELMSILVFHKPPGKSILNYWRAATGVAVVSSTSMTINGYAALNLDEEIPPQSEGESGPTSDLLLQKNNTLFVVFNPSPFDSLSRGVSVPDAILNSFRF